MRRGPLEIKSPREIEIMREAGRLAADTLMAVDALMVPGTTTDEVDAFVVEDTRRKGCISAPFHYKGFPRSVCTSINEVVCHGIPGPRKLAAGDIVNIDITHIFEGFHGDTSATFYIGTPSEAAKKVTEVARRALDLAIAVVRPKSRLGDIGATIQELAEGEGCGVVRDFTGHGIGRNFHEEPQIPHFGKRGRGRRLHPGMTFTIEPMINQGTWELEVLADGWTAVTLDRGLSAQFEHTLLVTDTGCEILTARPRPLAHSEIFPDYWS